MSGTQKQKTKQLTVLFPLLSSLFPFFLVSPRVEGEISLTRIKVFKANESLKFQTVFALLASDVHFIIILFNVLK